MGLVPLVCLMTLLGCTKTIRVTIPPKVDLKAHNTIGMISFSVTGKEGLQQGITESFIARAQAAQPGVRIVELGTEEQVLQSAGCKSLDFKCMNAIGEKFGVASLMTGVMEVSQVKPKLQVSPNLTSVSAQAYITGSLVTKLRETKTGATVWTSSGSGKWSLANVSVANKNPVNFGISDVPEKYRKMMWDLTYWVTEDLRPTYEKRKVEEN